MNIARQMLRSSWTKVGADHSRFAGSDGTHAYRVELGNAWNVFVDGKPLKSISGRFKRFSSERKAFAAAERHAETLWNEARQGKLFGGG